ncbi:MAG: hypothetical protein LBT05_01530 [Planctomycetaceae bacterium]|nr:hypothetical protein [Planctomycetaceae bacterium]
MLKTIRKSGGFSILFFLTMLSAESGNAVFAQYGNASTIPVAHTTYYESFNSDGSVATLAQAGYDDGQETSQQSGSAVVLSSTAALESRLIALEEEFAKAKSKDTKKEDENKWTNKVGGRFFLDAVNFSDLEPVAGNRSENYFALSEARITFSGSGYRNYDYKAELYFGSGNFGIRDLYLGVKKVPIFDYVKIGHYKVETGAAYLVSTNYTTGMGFPAATNQLSFNRRFGISSTQLFADDRVRWFTGIFTSDSGNFNNDRLTRSDSPGIVYNTRLSLLPFASEDGKHYLHVGGNWTYHDYDKNASQAFNLKPGITFNSASNQLALGTISNVNHAALTGAELVYTHNRFGASAEFQAMSYGRGRTVYGGYGELRYFLTDAYREYDKANGVVGAPKVKNGLKFTERSDGYCGIDSFGDWEVFAQLNYLDFGDIVPSSGQQDYVFGLNWFWNANTRMIFEYVHSVPKLQGDSDYSDIYAASLRFHF